MFDYKLLGVLLAALTLACGAPPEPPVEMAEEVSEMPPADAAGAEIPELAPTPPGSTRFELGEGTRVYYRVREQLVGVSFLNDAVGVSNGISGAIVVGPDGSIDSSLSRLTLDLSTFSSDQARRDNFLRRRVFEVEENPEAVFVARSVSSSPLPPISPERFSIAKTNTYFTNHAYFTSVRKAREEFYRDSPPTSTAVPVAGLVHPDMLAEIEAVALIE